MSDPWSPARRARGFTLIEVIGALLIFAVGVLMIIQVSTALGRQMVYSAARSQIVVLANERLDSLEATPFDSISTGTTVAALTIEGIPYNRSVVVTQITPVLRQIVVTFAPAGGAGPTYSATSYASAVW